MTQRASHGRPTPPRAPRSKAKNIARIWNLRDEGSSDHAIAAELELSVIYVRRILAAGRRN